MVVLAARTRRGPRSTAAVARHPPPARTRASTCSRRPRMSRASPARRSSPQPLPRRDERGPRRLVRGTTSASPSCASARSSRSASPHVQRYLEGRTLRGAPTPRRRGRARSARDRASLAPHQARRLAAAARHARASRPPPRRFRTRARTRVRARARCAPPARARRRDGSPHTHARDRRRLRAPPATTRGRERARRVLPESLRGQRGLETHRARPSSRRSRAPRDLSQGCPPPRRPSPGLSMTGRGLGGDYPGSQPSRSRVGSGHARTLPRRPRYQA